MGRTAGGNAVKISGVNLKFGTTHVLKDIDLEIYPGELFAFLGPSGCGKTTLLRNIAGFNQAESGRVLIGSQDVSTLPPWKRNVGMVFQSYALWPHMSVARNVAFGLEERGVPRQEVTRRVQAALDMVGMGALGHRRPSELSGGQQQRVALARTIVTEPKVLLLDEPLSNLDAQLRVEVRRELRELQQRLAITTIFVTHDQEEANSICDRMAVMDSGRIQQVGSPIELYEHPDNLFVAGFLGTANILQGHLVEDGPGRAFALTGGGRIAIAGNADAHPASGSKLVFRPQHAQIETVGEQASAGRVAEREFLGATVRYSVMIGQQEAVVDQPFMDRTGLLEVGTPVRFTIKPGCAVWLNA